MYKRVSTAVLPDGSVLGSPIYDQENRKLLAAGIAVTPPFMEGLKRRGIRSVVVDERDVAKLNIGDENSNLPNVRRIASCVDCDNALPLRSARPNERPKIWVCRGCGASYTAVLDEISSTLVENVKPGKLALDRSKLAPPPPAMELFVHELVDHHEWKNDKRAAVRYSVLLSMPAQPLDTSFHVVGEPFMVISRNVSHGGIALVHTRAVLEKWLAVDISPPQREAKQMLVEVLRCEHFGRFYEIGGKFSARLNTA